MIQIAQQFVLVFNQLYIHVRLLEGCKHGIYITENIPDTICLLLAYYIANCLDTVIQLQNQLYIVTQFYSEIIVFKNGSQLRPNENNSF